jgi:hypothetical protein
MERKQKTVARGVKGGVKVDHCGGAKGDYFGDEGRAVGWQSSAGRRGWVATVGRSLPGRYSCV